MAAATDLPLLDSGSANTSVLTGADPLQIPSVIASSAGQAGPASLNAPNPHPLRPTPAAATSSSSANAPAAAAVVSAGRLPLALPPQRLVPSNDPLKLVPVGAVPLTPIPEGGVSIEGTGEGRDAAGCEFGPIDDGGSSGEGRLAVEQEGETGTTEGQEESLGGGVRVGGEAQDNGDAGEGGVAIEEGEQEGGDGEVPQQEEVAAGDGPPAEGEERVHLDRPQVLSGAEAVAESSPAHASFPSQPLPVANISDDAAPPDPHNSSAQPL